MKKHLTFFLIFLISFFLTSCFGIVNHNGPIYIEKINLFIDNQLVEGKLQYFDSDKKIWLDYETKIKEKKNVYYTIDISLEDNLEIEFIHYSPKLVIKETKIVTNNDFEPMSYNTINLMMEDKEGNYTNLNYTFKKIDGSFNVIKIPSWMTDKGLKYQGTNPKGTNYILWGVHLNFI